MAHQLARPLQVIHPVWLVSAAATTPAAPAATATPTPSSSPVLVALRLLAPAAPRVIPAAASAAEAATAAASPGVHRSRGGSFTCHAGALRPDSLPANGAVAGTMTDPPSVKPLLKRVLLGQVLFTWHTIKRKWLRATVVRCNLSPEVRLLEPARGCGAHTRTAQRKRHVREGRTTASPRPPVASRRPPSLRVSLTRLAPRRAGQAVGGRAPPPHRCLDHHGAGLPRAAERRRHDQDGCVTRARRQTGESFPPTSGGDTLARRAFACAWATRLGVGTPAAWQPRAAPGAGCTLPRFPPSRARPCQAKHKPQTRRTPRA